MDEGKPWKRKRRGLFGDDFFFDFDNIEKMMDGLMEKMMDDENALKRPLVLGFSMKMGSDGKIVFDEFGNVKKERGKPVVADTREPLVNVTKTDREIIITAELPGVEKKDISLRIRDKRTVVISVASKEKPYYKEVTLDAEIDKKSAKVNFNNGILEVIFKTRKKLFGNKKLKVKIRRKPESKETEKKSEASSRRKIKVQ